MFAGATDRVLREEHQAVSSVMVVCLQLNSRLLAAVGADLPCLRIYIHPRKGNKWRRRRWKFSHETLTEERRARWICPYVWRFVRCRIVECVV